MYGKNLNVIRPKTRDSINSNYLQKFRSFEEIKYDKYA